MLKTKVIAPSRINVKNGTKLRNELSNGTLSATILATIYNQRRKVYNQSVKNNAFFFLIIQTSDHSNHSKTYFEYAHQERSPDFYTHRRLIRLPDGRSAIKLFNFGASIRAILSNGLNDFNMIKIERFSVPC